MQEIWKDIEGHEGIYQVSNLGRVKSLSREIPVANHGAWRTRTIPEKILKLHLNENGYVIIILTKDKVRATKKMHRVVAEAFIPNPENKRCVNHIDGNKENNCVDNLEWVTHKENMEHAVANGLYTCWCEGKHFHWGKGGHSEESKAKMREARKGKKPHSMPHTEEAKRKISEAKKAYYQKKKLEVGI